MKKISALFLAVIMILSFCACGKKNESSQSVENPMHETTEEEITKMFGEILLPAGYENVSYYTIDAEHTIYQIKFSLEGVEYSYRISAENEIQDTSGMFYEWKNEETADVEGREAVVKYNEGEQGIIYWYDIVPGLNYSLSMNSEASSDKLITLANNMFVCVQGDS